MALSQKQEIKQDVGFSISELLELFSFNAPPGSSLFSISTDSRKITNKQIFLPLKGEKFDGHKFINTVLDTGVQYAFC